jgi:hypothetical protein
MHTAEADTLLPEKQNYEQDYPSDPNETDQVSQGESFILSFFDVS